MSDIRYWLYPFVFIVLSMGMSPALATPWTLESSIQRALEHAPELEAAQARVAASRAATDQAGAWPNPSIELRVDDRLGRELGDGGRDVTALSITQPLSWGKVGARRELARTAIAWHLADIDDTRLDVEIRAAGAFHRLQLAQAQLELARDAAVQASDIARVGKRRADAGDLPRLEWLRLELLAAQYRQAVEEAEGEWSEAAAGFAVLTGLEARSTPRVAPFEQLPEQPPLEHWLAATEAHPMLRQGRLAIDLVSAERALTRRERLPDIALVVYREYEAIAGAKEAVSGAGVTIEVPLWDRRRGRIDELTARGAEAEARLRGEQRSHLGDVRMRYLHLRHLVEQARRQAAEVLAPAREVMSMTRRAYEAGEVELPSLIEAIETARAAEYGYQQSLFNAWQELARLRADAGVTLDHFHREAGR